MKIDGYGDSVRVRRQLLLNLRPHLSKCARTHAKISFSPFGLCVCARFFYLVQFTLPKTDMRGFVLVGLKKKNEHPTIFLRWVVNLSIGKKGKWEPNFLFATQKILDQVLLNYNGSVVSKRTPASSVCAWHQMPTLNHSKCTSPDHYSQVITD